MTEYQICNRCVMDTNGDPDITFDEQGFCNYCTSALNLVDRFPEPGDLSKVEVLFNRIKSECRDVPYDCLVGISGGLDSSYVAYLGHQFDLRMLGIHIDDGLDTETAQKNIQTLCKKANITLYSVRPDLE